MVFENDFDLFAMRAGSGGGGEDDFCYKIDKHHIELKKKHCFAKETETQSGLRVSYRTPYPLYTGLTAFDRPPY